MKTRLTPLLLNVVYISIGVTIGFMVLRPTKSVANLMIEKGISQQIARFLSPPYYGTTRVNAIYDHQLPMGRPDLESASDRGQVRHYDNILRDENCGGVDARECYSSHNGIDYDLEYNLVRAAAPGQVIYAGWNLANHSEGFGLYVHIRHANAYDTLYGHMSVLRVQTDDTIAQRDEFQRIIGFSGNTGNSTGPHLHFELEPPNNATSVNPYGWNSEENDPWEQSSQLVSHDLWLSYPSISNTTVYTSGYPLTAPFITEDKRDYITVDDGDAGFVEDPANCWTGDATAGWSNDHRYHEVDATVDCAATWNFPESQRPGKYHVFVHIPPAHASSDAAQYTVRHTASGVQPWEKVSEWAVVNQSVYPNDDHPSSWVYIGTYYFDSNQHGTDYVRLEPQPLDPVGASRIAADAVRFSPVIYRLYLPLTLRQWPPVPTTPLLNAIVNPDYAPNYAVAWSSVENASSYTLQEGSNPSFGDAVTRYNGPDTAWAATDHAPGEFYYRVKAANPWGDSLWSAPQHVKIVSPDPCKKNFLVNGDFEDETSAPWEQYSSGGYNVISTERAYSGDQSVYFGGFKNAEEWVRQPFVIPANAETGVLVFRRLITTTADVFPFDYLTCEIQDAEGNTLSSLVALSSLHASNSWLAAGAAIDNLDAWAGRTLQMKFTGHTNSSDHPTEFFVDAVILSINCADILRLTTDDAFPIIHLPPPTP